MITFESPQCMWTNPSQKSRQGSDPPHPSYFGTFWTGNPYLNLRYIYKRVSSLMTMLIAHVLVRFGVELHLAHFLVNISFLIHFCDCPGETHLRADCRPSPRIEEHHHEAPINRRRLHSAKWRAKRRGHWFATPLGTMGLYSCLRMKPLAETLSKVEVICNLFCHHISIIPWDTWARTNIFLRPIIYRCPQCNPKMYGFPLFNQFWAWEW